MTELPLPLKGLATYNQFIIYKLIPKENGKTDKIPLNPYTLEVADSQDKSVWVSADIACSLATLHGLGVAYVFTMNDPFFFVDIDDCQDSNGQWNPIANWLCSEFSGACVEVSQSGRGLHIIGTGVVSEERRKKCKEYNFDIYTSGRFIALTGHHAIGDVNFNHQNKLEFICQTYLKRDNSIISQEWTNKPVEEWSGHLNDEDLIRHALRMKSADSVFSGKASFEDLWTGNTQVLGETYPHDQGTEPFDHSAADAALCCHLAYWTGKDCERIDRLFRQSALYRDKWNNRPEYIKATVFGANSLCKTVHKGVTQVDTKLPPNQFEQPSGFEISAKSGDTILTASQQEEYFKGCVYVIKNHMIYMPDGELLKPEQFKAVMGGYKFAIDYTNTKTINNAFEAFVESKCFSFPKAHATCFRPEHESGACIIENGLRLVNTYKPVEMNIVQGDPTPFLQWLQLIIPNPVEREITLCWMAAMIQYKGVKFQWAPVFQGVQGNGKTFISTILTKAIGERYCHTPKAKDLAGKGSQYNAWLTNKLFICVEEINMGNKAEFEDTMKEIITNKRVEAEGKGVNQTMIDNRANFMFTTNHKDGVRKHRTDRRYCIIYTAQQTVEDLIKDGFLDNNEEPTELMSNLYDWANNQGYGVINNYLLNYKINEKYNPAGKCHRAPRTASTDEAMDLSRGQIENEILEAARVERVGFCGDLISSIALSRLLEQIRGTSKVAVNKRKTMMFELGYIPHPALREGRLHVSSVVDNGKPILYVKKDSLAANLTTPDAVLDHYLRSNSGVGGVDHAHQAFR